MSILKLPERIRRLDELSFDVWWSWHDGARKLFRALDYPLWKASGHNTVKQLKQVTPGRLEEVARDPSFLKLYDRTVAEYEQDLGNTTNWTATQHPELTRQPVAYFSMEYALHNSLPIYAGGLGALAGDICKECSDLGLPLVAVGFMYPQGYFRQHLSAEGQQEEIYQKLDFTEAPITRVLNAQGGPVIASAPLNHQSLDIGVWQVRVGRTIIYLLDTALESNPEPYRELSARLYTADRESRIRQELVLGIGGVRVLRALGIDPILWHANEGHTAFMTLERAREKVAAGMTFDEASREVRAATIFTTHTPVPSGHDVFDLSLVDHYLASYPSALGIDRDTFLRLGQPDGGPPKEYNMTALALRMADQRCGVSRLHGEVTRKMWHKLWPDIPEDEVPISHVTNGVHTPTWIAFELYYLFAKHLGADWMQQHDDPELWSRIHAIPDEELWEVRRLLKRKLVGAIRERMRYCWIEDNAGWGQMMSRGALLDPDVLTIAYARRFTEYKRPTLLFRDVDRLKRILTNSLYPVQIILAGKSHPADLASKQLLRQVYELATDRELQGRIVFVEDYDIHVAHYLVQGVDVWLNTPRRLQEACGTSGMKAAINGTLNLSIRDGWWSEGYNHLNGWAIGREEPYPNPQAEDDADAPELYRLLEEEIIPLYYQRDVSGMPRTWLRLTKESIRTVITAFSARRMMKDYVEQLYLPALKVRK
ncbi:MAG: alpha-glucan family phosphorylase [Chloroflexota bacterium]